MKFIPILFSTPMVQANMANRKSVTRRLVDNVPDDLQGSIQWGFSCFTPTGYYSLRTKFKTATGHNYGEKFFKLKYGKAGDVLWVRETFWEAGKWAQSHPEDDEWGVWQGHKRFHYVADGNPPNEPNGVYPDGLVNGAYSAASPAEIWRKMPSIHMPKIACRTFLLIKSIRVERLYDISEKDAISEGVEWCIADKQKFGCRAAGLKLYRDYARKDNSLQDHPCNGFDNARSSFETLWCKIHGIKSWDANPWLWVIDYEKIEKPEGFL